ncbi:MAG: hypothetical protein ACOC31_00970, partial [Bacteroidota bacterium]
GTPPPIMEDKEEFEKYRAKRIEESGTSWFLEYTVIGRSSMVKKDGWKYCFYTNDREELYNCNEDSLELHNLAMDPKYADKKAEMKELWMEKTLSNSMTSITDHVFLEREKEEL